MSDLILLSPYPAAAGGGPPFSSVKFLSFRSGTNGATDAVDESPSNHDLTFVGNAQLDTSEVKFPGAGRASLLLDGSGDYVTVPDHADWPDGTGDWTLEGWVRFSSITGNHVFCSHYENTTNQRSFFLRRTTGNLLTLITSSNGLAFSTAEGSWTPVVDTWYFVQSGRDGDVRRIGVDGVEVDNVTSTNAVFDSNQPLIFGAVNSGGFGQFFPGRMYDWRLTKGVWRGFYVPTEPFPNS